MYLAHTDFGKYAALEPTFAAIALVLAAVGRYAVMRDRSAHGDWRGGLGCPSNGSLCGLSPVTIGMIIGLATALAAQSDSAIAIGRRLALSSGHDRGCASDHDSGGVPCRPYSGKTFPPASADVHAVTFRSLECLDSLGITVTAYVSTI
jgi:hypothetical protein